MGSGQLNVKDPLPRHLVEVCLGEDPYPCRLVGHLHPEGFEYPSARKVTPLTETIAV